MLKPETPPTAQAHEPTVDQFLSESLHSLMGEMDALGLVPKRTMRDFKGEPPIPKVQLTALEIRSLRTRENVS